MSKSNGQTDVHVEEQKENLEHELPAADPGDGFQEKQQSANMRAEAAPAEPAMEAELRKVRSERDNLLDRLARLQAEFDNSRKRAAKENADYRDYAVTDAARSLLPVVDSFELALKNADVKPEYLRKDMALLRKQLHDAVQKMNVQGVTAQSDPIEPGVPGAI